LTCLKVQIIKIGKKNIKEEIVVKLIFQ
jgi:hypothetical protein